MDRLEAGLLSDGTLALLAVLGSLAFLSLGFLLAIFIIILFDVIVRERKFLKIIDNLRNQEKV